MRIIALLVFATFVVVLNETILAIAMPQLMEAFAISAARVQWLTTAYLITLSVVLPATGTLHRRYGTRRLYLSSMGAFTAGTALAATAPTFEVLLAARVIQATGTALMKPMLMTTVMRRVDASRRGEVMGSVTVVVAVAPVVGPTLAGLVVDAFGWRWIFGGVLPFAVLALTVGARWVRDDEPAAREATLDGRSLVLSAAAFLPLVYGLSALGLPGGAEPLVPAWAALAGGGVALTCFAWRQLLLAAPLLELRVLRDRRFALATTIIALTSMSLYGVVVMIPLYTQEVLGVSAAASGLAMLPGSLMMGAMSLVAGRVFDRVGSRRIVPAATLLMLTSLFVLGSLGSGAPFWQVVAGDTLFSIGLGLVMTPLLTEALSALPAARQAHGSALITTTEQIGGAAGIAVFLSAFTAAEAAALVDGASAVAARADGVQWAMYAGAALACLAVMLAAGLSRAPAPAPGRTPPAAA